MQLILRFIVLFVLLYLNPAKAKRLHGCGDFKNYCHVSIINLLTQPELYHEKNIVVKGYIHKAPKGPFWGYWTSPYKENLDFSSSIKLIIPKEAPQNKWIKESSYYIYVGTFINCEMLNCRPQIEWIKSDPRIVMPFN